MQKQIKQSLFSFSEGNRDEILKETLNLDTTKAFQDTDLPTKLLGVTKKMQIYFQTFCLHTLVLVLSKVQSFHQS